MQIQLQDTLHRGCKGALQLLSSFRAQYLVPDSFRSQTCAQQIAWYCAQAPPQQSTDTSRQTSQGATPEGTVPGTATSASQNGAQHTNWAHVQAAAATGEGQLAPLEAASYDKMQGLFTRVMQVLAGVGGKITVSGNEPNEWRAHTEVPELKWVEPQNPAGPVYSLPAATVSFQCTSKQEAKLTLMRHIMAQWANAGLISRATTPTMLGHPLPVIVDGFEPVSSYIDNAALKTIPVDKWKGRTHLIAHAADARDAVRFIKERGARSEEDAFLGFDLEFQPHFYKGAGQACPSVVQVALADDVFVFHVHSFAPRGNHERFPDRVGPLQPLLTDQRLLKCGVGVLGDRDLIHQFCPGLQTEGWLELMHIATELDFRRKSLAGLCALLLGFTISKKQQLSNWGRRKLDAKQIEYAATDAWVSREIALKLVNMLRHKDPSRAGIERLHELYGH